MNNEEETKPWYQEDDEKELNLKKKEKQIKVQNNNRIIEFPKLKWKTWKFIIAISIALFSFLIIGTSLGIVAYTRSQNYYLKSNGEIVYCNSTIWMRVDKSTKEINGSLRCDYMKPEDGKNYEWKKWTRNYPKGYFKYEKEAS